MRKFLALLVCLCLALSQLMAQTRTITGKVTDEKGAAVAGATVHVKGTTTATTTDADGNYSISVSPNAKALIASLVGFANLELPIGGQRAVRFSLKRSSEDLAEVVVQIPYGTVKKSSFTGSEGTVNASVIAKQQVTSVTRMIEGQIPGVIATNGGGAPGTNASILIRGIGSVNASSSPLYVVNGAPYDGSISALSSDDIESLTVLKDAAAISLFGSRAANGVIMITTKKGRKGRAAVVASMRQGYSSRAIPEYNRLNPQQYYEMFWEAYRNQAYYTGNQTMAQAGVTASNILTDPTNGLVYNAYNVPGNTLVDPVSGKLNPSAKLLWNEPWSSALFRTAGRTNPTISISGADDKTDYYVSANYLDEQGTAKFSDYKRYGLRATVNTQATEWLKTGLNIDVESDDRTGLFATGTATSNPFYYSRNMGPIYPVYQHNLTTGAIVNDSLTGKPALDYGTPAQMGARPYAGNSNLLGTLALDVNEQKRITGNMNTYAEVRFLKDFTFKTSLAYNAVQANTLAYQNNQFGDAQGVAGRSNYTTDLQTSMTANEVLNWGKNFGKHSIHALAGHENYKLHDDNFTATKTGFAYNGQTALDDASVVEGIPSTVSTDLRLESYFAGANYGFDDKYFASASVRRDGSSRFSSFTRWGTFYSVGLGWVLTKEKFLSNVSWLNNLKLRGSYGSTGNDNIGLYYQYIGWYYTYDGLADFAPPTGLANPNLKWESNIASNVAIDFNIFKKLSGTVEVYQRKSKDLLFNVPLAPQTGLVGGIWENIGQSKNTGIETQLSYAAITKKNFDWRIDFNISSFKNTITQLPPTQRLLGIVAGNKKLTEGGSIYDFWLRHFVGVDPATGLSLYNMDVLDATGKVTGKTLTSDVTKATLYKGPSAIPKFQGGLTNSFRYKDFDLSVLIVYSYGGKYYDGNYAGLMTIGSPGTAWSTDILKRWQKPGDITNVPRVQVASAQDGASDRFLLDASYANLKNATLGYQLNSGISRKLHVNDLRVFTSIDNAFILTAKKGGDPQQSFGGTPGPNYPPYRTITFGITLKL